MLSLTLYRLTTSNSGTLGVLYGPNGVICKVMEPPWRNNRRNVSCIPTGVYTVNYLRRSASGKYRDVYHIIGVENRGGILIHKGNLVSDTFGCLLPGMKYGLLRRRLAVLGSKTAVNKIHRITHRKRFKLHVRDYT